MADSKRIAELKAEHEAALLRAEAIQTELTEAEKADSTIPVYRRSWWDSQSPKRQHEICAAVNAGQARLID